MPQFIYGDSYGDVGNRALATDQASDARYFQMLAANRAAQEEANRVANQQANLGFQYSNMNATLGDAAANRAQQLQLSGVNSDFQNRSLAQTAELADKGIQAQKDIENMKLLDTDKRLDLGEQGRLHQEAYQAIQTGSVRTPDQLTAFLGGKLPAADSDRLHMVLQEANNERLKQYGSGNNAAETVNQEYKQRVLDPYQSGYDAAQKKIATAPYAADKHWYFPSTYGASKEDLAQSTPVSSYTMARTKFFEDLAKNKSYNALTEYDPFANRFVNTVPRPDVGGVPVTQPQAAAAPGISAVTALTTDNWIPYPSAGIRVNPVDAADIKLRAAAFKNPADQSAYVRQRLQQAIQQGRAIPLARPPVPSLPSPIPFQSMGPPQAPQPTGSLAGFPQF